MRNSANDKQIGRAFRDDASGRTARRTRLCGATSAAVGGLSIGTLGVLGYLLFVAGASVGAAFLPAALAALGGAIAAELLFVTAWMFAWSLGRPVTAVMGRPLGWAAICFGGLLPGLLILIVAGLFLLQLFASRGA